MSEDDTSATEAAELMFKFRDLARRFGGVDLQRRNPSDAAWPAPWRAKLVTNKSERSEYRITVYGSTWADAVAKLLFAISEIDQPRSGAAA